MTTALAAKSGLFMSAAELPNKLEQVFLDFDATKFDITQLSCAAETYRLALPYIKPTKEADALAELSAQYWDKALALTDVRDFMPEKRRREWAEQIEKRKTPPFERPNVIATISALLERRMDFLAEMVDGIFSNLSHTHATNSPEGFQKRMIISCVTTYSSYAYRSAGYVHDFRSIAARIMGHDQPREFDTRRIIEDAVKYNRGEWLELDGGIWRLRCYAKGTGHIDIHPKIARFLNDILAHKYPRALFHERNTNTKPTRPNYDGPLHEETIPHRVRNAIREGISRTDGNSAYKTTVERYYVTDYADYTDALEIMEALGATIQGTTATFDYDATDILRKVIYSGVIPDDKSHQFYPTPKAIAGIVAQLAECEAGHKILEPSAGVGGLADEIKCAGVECVEVSPLRCEVLQAKGYKTTCADFLEVQPEGKYDRIIMNPPFNKGRAEAHLKHAVKHLATNGVLVCILPKSIAARVAESKIERVTLYEIPRFKSVSIDIAAIKIDRRTQHKEHAQ